MKKTKPTNTDLSLYKEQYNHIKKVLQKYDLTIKNIPEWSIIKKYLTFEILNKASKLEQPTLLAIPPISLESKKRAIDKHPAKCQKAEVFYYNLDNNDLWNGGKKDQEKKWRIVIVEGIENVTIDLQITKNDATNYEMAKGYVKKYTDQGLDIMNDAHIYLILMIKSLSEEKPIDSESWNILNAKTTNDSALMGFGGWYSGDKRVFLESAIPDLTFHYLRVRAMVVVDIFGSNQFEKQNAPQSPKIQSTSDL